MDLDSVKIIGSGGTRKPLDFYATPPEVTAALLDALKLPKSITIWEPACGDGAMADVMESYGYKVIRSDIQQGQDFLTIPKQDADWIITNPPFSLAEQFIRRAHEHDLSFAFLLKSQYWHSKKRLALIKEIPPFAILPLTWRPDFTGQGASLMDCIWVVWSNSFVKGSMPIYYPLERSRK